MLYQTIAKYERGEREPTWGALLKLAEALGVDLNAFLSDDDDQGDDAPELPPDDPPRGGKRK